jgi:mRNA-degrading endonuclease RelE of RelBE toxin-antitoxin system
MSLKIISLESFARDVKRLHKKYKAIGEDLRILKRQLQENPKVGIFLGRGCYKIRLRNTSVPTGKSGGFRVVYYYLDGENNLYLMTIWSKTEMENIHDEKIIEILEKYDL